MAADIVTDGDTSHAACPHDHSFAGDEARTSHLEVPLGKSQSAISDHTRVLTQTGLTAGRSAGQVDLVARRVRPASPPSGRCPAARRRPQRVFGQVTMLRWRRTSCGPDSGGQRQRRNEQYRRDVDAQHLDDARQRGLLSDEGLIARAPGFPGAGYQMENGASAQGTR